jgi:fructose-1,6-bisphosphatase I
MNSLFIFTCLLVNVNLIAAYVQPYVKRSGHSLFKLSNHLSMDSLEDYLATADSSHKSTGLVDIILAIARSCVQVKNIIARGSILDNSSGRDTGINQINASGEKQKPVDVLANDIVKSSLLSLPGIFAIISEEEDKPVTKPQGSENALGQYIVAYDPLDGSSNIDCAIPTGTIFAVYRSTSAEVELSSLTGSNIVAAGYAMYSGSTEMVISLGHDSQGFTLYPNSNIWVHTRKNIQVPERGPYYSLNEGRSSDWPKGLQRYISDIKGNQVSYSVSISC